MLEFATAVFRLGLDLTSYTVRQLVSLGTTEPQALREAPFAEPEWLPTTTVGTAPSHLGTPPTSLQPQQIAAAQLDFAQAPGWGPMP